MRLWWGLGFPEHSIHSPDPAAHDALSSFIQQWGPAGAAQELFNALDLPSDSVHGTDGSAGHGPFGADASLDPVRMTPAQRFVIFPQ